MKEISVTLEGEKAVFTWKDGQVYCEGYDLESEKTVLALTRFGKGIGVLLVAMNDCCKSEKELRSKVKEFVTGHKWLIACDFENGDWPLGQLIFEYFSHSSDSSIRWRGMNAARLSESHYERLLKDPDIQIKAMMASLENLPEKYFPRLAGLSNSDINFALGGNENCPGDLLEILAEDDDVTIRWNVACNLNCPEKILARDATASVREAAFTNLAKNKGLEV